MDAYVRPIAPDELSDFMRVDRFAFHDSRPPDPSRITPWVRLDLDRTRAAFDGDEMVAIGRNYSLDLVMPGGGPLPFAAVSWIATLPTHRRRGLLRAIMSELIDDAVQHGESLLGLLASESTIYGRFGFGAATFGVSFDIETQRAAFRRPIEGGRLRVLDESEARDVLPDVYTRERLGVPGAVSRPPEWWRDEYWDDPDVKGRRFCVVHERAGAVGGFASYTVDDKWEEEHSQSTADVLEVVASHPETRLALWRYLLDLDLVRTVRGDKMPLDDPVRLALAEPRRFVTRQLADVMWLRPIDVPAALAARTYASPGSLVIEVHDDFGGVASGRFVLEGGPDGAACRDTDAFADIACGVAELGAALLGGVRWGALGRAGLVDEERPGALARADAMFATDPLPFAGSWF